MKRIDWVKQIDVFDNIFLLLNILNELWAMPNGYRESMKDSVIYLELHTGGLSDNEWIIEKLKQNKWFFTLFHTKWERGGHFYFEIKLNQIGYYRASDYARLKGVSRQAVHASLGKLIHWEYSGKTFIKHKDGK